MQRQADKQQGVHAGVRVQPIWRVIPRIGGHIQPAIGAQPQPAGVAWVKGQRVRIWVHQAARRRRRQVAPGFTAVVAAPQHIHPVERVWVHAQ
jgi:hypothetical protein